MKLRAGEFYGKTSGVFAANSYRFTEKSYGPNANLPSHSHEFAHFCLVLSGSYQERIGKREFSRQPSALVYYPPDVSHAESHLKNGRHFLIEIDSSGIERIRECGAKLNEPVTLNASLPTSLALRMYREFDRRDPFSALALESMTIELLIESSRADRNVDDRKAPVWLSRAKDHLNANYLRPPSLSDLALAAEVHPTHLARTFRKFENCTAGEYVRRVRLEKARQLIIDTDASLAAVAIETGFADQPHLTRVFRQATGLTPAEFRRIFGRR